MRFLVAMVSVPDTTSKIEFVSDNKELKKEGVTFIFNPYDDYALTRALELKQAGDQVVVLTIGPADTEPLLRKALAMGADEAIRIDALAQDAFAVASEIALHAKDFEVILLGKESISHNEGLIGGMLSALLNRPFIAEATALEIKEGKANCQVDGPQGSQLTLEAALPLIISASEGIVAQVAMPNMRGIMAAKTKPLKVVPAQATTVYVENQNYELPPARMGCEFFKEESTVEGKVKRLVEALKNTEKVI